MNMDPLSIARLAAAGARTLSAVVDLIAEYKQVDTSVRSLESLGKGLARVLDRLAESLNDPVLNYQKNAGVWASVHRSVESCESTVEDLEMKLAPIRESARNGVQQAWRAVTLGLQQPDVNRIVSNMKTHSVNLQLALQTVNVIVTTSIPGAITADQAGRFDRLERMIEAIRLHIDSIDGPARAEADNNGLRAVTIDHNTTELFLSAASIVTSSMAGTVRSGSPLESPLSPITPLTTPRLSEPAFEDYACVVSPSPFMIQGSEALSLDEEHRAQIHDWIPGTPGGVIPEDESEVIPLDEDYDDDFEFEVTVEIFEAGMDYYSQRRFVEAQEHLSRGLDRAKKLTAERRDDLDINSMQFHHALSCMAQSHLEEARTSFQLVITSPSTRESDGHLRCLAFYQLARVYLRLSQSISNSKGSGEALEAAEKHCKQAVSRMRKEPSIGKEHPAYFGALSLLSLIYWARGHRIEARATAKLLPPALHILDNQFDEQLSLVFADFVPTTAYQRQPGSSASTSPTPNFPHPPESAVPVELMGPRRPSGANEKILASDDYAIVESTRSLSLQHPAERIAHLRSPGNESTTSFDNSSIRYYNAAAAADIIRRKGFRKQINKGLYWAAECGNLEVLNILLEQEGADINIRKPSFWKNEETLLRTAVLNGQYPICERLVAAGTSIDAMIEGQTALDAAIDKCNVEICRLLLDHGANANGQSGQRTTPLLRAVNCGNQAVRELVASYVEDIDDPRFVDTRKLRTALMQGAAYNRTKAMRWLLDLGADPNGPDPSITTPLIEAARANAIDASRLLLQRGADLHLSTAKGATAARAATGWLKGFLLAWPDSRDWKEPEFTMTLQP